MSATGEISHSRPWITDADMRAVQEVMMAGMLAEGNRVRRFEEMVATYHRAPGAVAVSSGTAGLSLALLALGVGSGDEVILPTYTCQAVADAVRIVGAAPVYCDVGDLWLMTPVTVEAVMTPRTRAIILVHIFGIFGDVREFERFGIPIVEDACQAFGRSPSDGASAVTVFSFHATKCLTTGEGGAVITNDSGTLQRLRTLQESHAIPCRLSDLQAALGVSQLARYDEFLRVRQTQAQEYFSQLPSEVTDSVRSVCARSMFFRFPLRLDAKTHRFEEAREFFAEAGIAVRRGVDALLHRGAKLADTDFAGAVRCFEETVSIPLRPGLSDGDRGRIIKRAREYVGR